MSKLREAAIALYDRWDSPLWKDLPATARYMNDLCEALNEPDRMETEYQAATLRIDNDLMVIAALTAERDALKDAARLALDALERILYKDCGEPAFFKVREAIAALKAVL